MMADSHAAARVFAQFPKEPRNRTSRFLAGEWMESGFGSGIMRRVDPSALGENGFSL
jgi:hypothetical protein